MNQFLETFLKEWDLYQKQGGTPTVDECRTSEHAGDFDKSVRAGEIRVFADSNRQLVGLVYKSWGDEGWIVIPISDFSVPATEQEILIGSRVFQLWNAFTASAEFTEKSWLIDTLSLDELQDICAALLHTTIGEPLRDDLVSCLGEKITSAEDPRLEYERTFVAKPGRSDLDKRIVWIDFKSKDVGIAAADDSGNDSQDFQIEGFDGTIRFEFSHREHCVYMRVYDGRGELSGALDGWEVVGIHKEAIGKIGRCGARLTLSDEFGGRLAIQDTKGNLVKLRKVGKQ